MNGNGKNGLFLKVLVGVLTIGLAGAGGGLIKLYREVGVLQVDSHQDRRIERLEALAADIATDRDKRTIMLQDILRRLDNLERRR